jgi:hypothetical protein
MNRSFINRGKVPFYDNPIVQRVIIYYHMCCLKDIKNPKMSITRKEMDNLKSYFDEKCPFDIKHLYGVELSVIDNNNINYLLGFQND